MNHYNLLPKSTRLQNQADSVIEVLRRKQFSAFEDSQYASLVKLDWVAEPEFTKPELVLIGFCIGANLPCGTTQSIIQSVDPLIHPEVKRDLVEEIAQWLFANKTHRKEAIYYASKGDYATVGHELNEMSNIWAICCAIVLGLEFTEHCTKLIPIMEQAIESGFEESCF